MNASELPVYPEEAHMSIATGIILSIVTFGIYSLIWKHKQFQTINLCRGRNQFSILSYILLSLITCGIYAVYTDYKAAEAIQKIQREYQFPVSKDLPLISILCTLFGLGIVTLAIQQSTINDFFVDYEDFE